MTPNQTINKTREELNAMADRCRDMAQDLEDLADGLPIVPVNCETISSTPLPGFACISKMLRNGQRPEPGQMVHTTLTDGTVAKWRVIDTTHMAQLPGTELEPVVAQLVEILHYRPFSRPDKQHPWGWNNYEASELAAWMDKEYLDRMNSMDKDCIIPRHDLGGKEGRMFWLLSTEEAGFDDLDKAFDWYACEDEDQRDERRKLKDSDGDAAIWWLRTPHSGNATSVRVVYTDGSLYDYHADYGGGVAPACIIG